MGQASRRSAGPRRLGLPQGLDELGEQAQGFAVRPFSPAPPPPHLHSTTHAHCLAFDSITDREQAAHPIPLSLPVRFGLTPWRWRWDHKFPSKYISMVEAREVGFPMVEVCCPLDLAVSPCFRFLSLVLPLR